MGQSKHIINRILQQNTTCFRPPYLLTDRRVRASVEQNGMWQVRGYATPDYKRIGVNRLVRIVLRAVAPGQALIFHDGYNRGSAQTVAALPAIIQGIRKKGLRFSLMCQPK